MQLISASEGRAIGGQELRQLLVSVARVHLSLRLARGVVVNYIVEGLVRLRRRIRASKAVLVQRMEKSMRFEDLLLVRVVCHFIN